MSFLKEVQQFQAKALRKTETHVTTSDGRRLLEQHNDHGQYTSQHMGTDLGFVGDYKPDLQVASVLPGLLLGSQDVAASKELLDQNKVTHILNVAPGIEPCFPQDFCYTSVPILDLPETDITAYFPQCFELISNALENGGRIFVHCNAGVSRSASVVIGYLIRHHNKKFNEAYDLVKSERPAIQPNAGFIKQLQRYNLFC